MYFGSAAILALFEHGDICCPETEVNTTNNQIDCNNSVYVLVYIFLFYIIYFSFTCVLFIFLYILYLRHILPVSFPWSSLFSCVLLPSMQFITCLYSYIYYVRWVPLSPQNGASTGCGWKGRRPAMEGSCAYIEKAAAYQRQGVVLQLGGWAKSKLVTKRIH
jgi:hypothetical protein